jgi:hypothetical protein
MFSLACVLHVLLAKGQSTLAIFAAISSAIFVF